MKSTTTLIRALRESGPLILRYSTCCHLKCFRTCGQIFVPLTWSSGLWQGFGLCASASMDSAPAIEHQVVVPPFQTPESDRAGRREEPRPHLGPETHDGHTWLRPDRKIGWAALLEVTTARFAARLLHATGALRVRCQVNAPCRTSICGVLVMVVTLVRHRIYEIVIGPTKEAFAMAQ